MKTPSTLIILFSFCLVLGYSQETTGIIKYRFMYSRTAPQEGKIVGEFIADYDIPAYLYFNTQKSLFDYDKTEYNKELKYKRKDDNYGQMYFIDKTKNELYIREFIYRATYITHEPVPVIAWQLKNEVKTISGYVCKKAEAAFRGRKYTAWYTSAIPVSVGPWKLQGLPGAILEAESEDKQVKFVVESVRIPADVTKELSLSELPDGKVVSYQEYREAFEKERKTNETFMYNLFGTSLKEEVKKGNIKADPNSLKITIFPMFTLEKYE